MKFTPRIYQYLAIEFDQRFLDVISKNPLAGKLVRKAITARKFNSQISAEALRVCGEFYNTTENQDKIRRINAVYLSHQRLKRRKTA